MAKNKFGQLGMVLSVYRVLARVLALGVPTIAAINGHSIGAGFFFALVCDHRIMSTGKGFMLLPELDLGMPLSPGFNSIARCKLDKKALRTSVLTAKRWSAEEAEQANVVDAAVAPEELMGASMSLASSLAAKKKRKRAVYSVRFRARPSTKE